MATYSVAEVPLELAPWQQLQPLLNVCYKRPPRNVFKRVVADSQQQQRASLAWDADGLLGLVILSPEANAVTSRISR